MIYLLVNPKAGRAQQSTPWKQLLADVGIEAAQLSDEIDTHTPHLNENDRLIVAGGDGTLSRHAPIVLTAGCTLGVLPAGTGNDFARGLAIPLDAESAIRNLRDGQVRRVDVGDVDGELFLNVAHIGFGVDAHHDSAKVGKLNWGRFAYLRALPERLRRARGFKAMIVADQRTLRGRWLQISVANGRSFGGGQRFFDADPFDGKLDLIAIRPRPWYTLFGLWMLARLRGAAPEHEAIVRLRGERFEILGDSSLEVTADGEPRRSLPAVFSVHPGQLRVILPSKANERG